MLSPDFVLSRSGFPDGKFYDLIQKVGRPKHIPKGKLIMRAGSYPTFFFYIKKGAFKTVVTTPRKNYILAFTFEDDIDCCPTTLLNNSPNNFNIEAVIDSDVLICDFEKFKKAAGKEEYINVMSNILLHYASFLEGQLIESLSLTAEERYQSLILQQPDKIKLIPLSLIASYLGITLERLSRIRKKMKA
jgi:CRP/FNR family transcriptional regulator, anaerobic regulatory protein